MSLRARLLAAFAYVLVIVIVALLVPLGINLQKRLHGEVESLASDQAELVATAASRGLGSPRQLGRLASESAQNLDGRVLIVDASGIVLADSETARTLGENYGTRARPELSKALGGRTEQGLRQSETLDEELLATAVPVISGGRVRGAVRVTQSVDAVNSAVRDDILALAGVAALALVIGLGVAWILAGSIARPLRGLAGVARRMAGGELGARAEPRGSREQVALSNAFNEMADRLNAVLDSQRDFVANASHQLRTPLTGLQLRIEAAKGKTRGAATARDLDAAERETQRLSELVSALLTLAESEEAAESAEEAELASVSSAAAERWRDTSAEAGHELVVLGRGTAVVGGSEADLAVILDNLIENAIKYSSPGSPIEIGWKLGDGAVVLAVSNRGAPLPEEELEGAFKRFQRGTGAARGGGTGLGLSIVAALARRWGASARLRNEPDGIAAEVVLVAADGTLPTHNPGPVGSMT
ncbi:MAG: HAMP domain-containing protein [Solirubrobacterales bacterium]|nr:HAMP domain-containing protein [Solirubrobacterales bacterium]